VHEELAELLLVNGDAAEAGRQFARAYQPPAPTPACRHRAGVSLGCANGGHAVNPAKRLEIYRRLRAQNPHPRGELEYRTPPELLIAVVLSAQATGQERQPHDGKVFPRAKTPRACSNWARPG
jgi:hypothetical protein